MTSSSIGNNKIGSNFALSLARFLLQDSLDLECLSEDTSTSRTEADKEDNEVISQEENKKINLAGKQQNLKIHSSTPEKNSKVDLPKSRLRSGKIFRRSKSSDCLVDIKLKFVTGYSEINQKKVEDIHTQKSHTNQQTTQLKINTDKGTLKGTHKENSKNTMADVSKINTLLHHNVPLLTAENSTNLKTEINVFIKCCEYVESCLSDEEKTIFMQLLGTRVRSKAAEVLEGIECNSIKELKKILCEKLLVYKPYHVLRGELQALYQFPGETVNSFSNRVNQLLKQCKEEIQAANDSERRVLEAELEEQALFIFKSGINNINLRWFCLADTEKTLEALLKKITKLESAERQSSNSRFETNRQEYMQTPFSNASQLFMSNNTPNTFTHTSSNNYQHYNNNSTPFTSNYSQNILPQTNDYRTNNSFNRMQRQDFRNNNSLNRANNFRMQEQKIIKCNFCGKNGHYFNDCRTRKNTPYCTNCKNYGHNSQNCSMQNRQFNNQRQVSTLNRNNNDRNNRILCDFCKRYGHRINECRAKQEWENKHGAQPSGNRCV